MKGNQKRQTVVHMIPRLYPGGAERLVLEYARRSDTKKERMYVMSSVGDGALRPYFEQSHAELFVGSRQDHGGRLGVWRVLKKQLQQIQPTILHTHLLGGDMIGYFWKRCTPSVKWVVTLHNVEHHTHWIKRVLWKHILKKADAIIAVSPAVARYASDVWHIREQVLTIVPNGIELSSWVALNADSLLSNTPYQLATIGRLEEQKGHTYLLQALAGVRGVSWEYHIFGDGSLREQLESQALQLGIADNVYFHGNVDNVAERLATIDLVVQPSLWEGMSLTVMEAMASGRVVLTTVPAGEGLIEDRQTGYIVPEADSDALARVLEEIFQATDMARGVAHAGRSFALSNFGIEKHIEAIHVVYQRITRNDA